MLENFFGNYMLENFLETICWKIFQNYRLEKIFGNYMLENLWDPYDGDLLMETF